MTPAPSPPDPDGLPRALVLSSVVPETVFAGSILLHRLFDTYPPDRLLVVGPRVQPTARPLPCRYGSLGQPYWKVLHSRFGGLARSLGAFGLFPAPRLSAEMRAEIDRFAPQVVVSVMQVLDYYRLAARTAAARGIPLVLIVHDLPEELEPVYPWAAGRQRRVNAAIYRAAARRLCVSPEMAEHLQREYGAPGDVLYPSPTEGLVARPPEESEALRRAGVLTVGYAGTLAYGYGQLLSRLVPGLAAAHTRLRLHTQARPDWADPAVVEWVGYAPAAETWKRVQAECDAVLLPYSWDDPGMQGLYRTHFPSKLPEYLALGMPVLIFGPEYATGVRWGLRNPAAAETVTANDPAAWAAAFGRLRADPHRRRALAEAGVAAGRRDFDPSAIRAAFWGHLAAAAGRAHFGPSAGVSGSPPAPDGV